MKKISRKTTMLIGAMCLIVGVFGLPPATNFAQGIALFNLAIGAALFMSGWLEE